MIMIKMLVVHHLLEKDLNWDSVKKKMKKMKMRIMLTMVRIVMTMMTPPLKGSQLGLSEEENHRGKDQ